MYNTDIDECRDVIDHGKYVRPAVLIVIVSSLFDLDWCSALSNRIRYRLDDHVMTAGDLTAASTDT